MLPRVNQNGFGAHHHGAAPVRAARRAGLVLDERDALAVDRDVDVFETRVGSRDEIDFEHVLGVRREHVVDDHPSPRAERRPVHVIPRML